MNDMNNRIILFMKRFNCIANRLCATRVASITHRTSKNIFPGLNLPLSQSRGYWVKHDSVLITPHLCLLLGRSLKTNNPIFDLNLIYANNLNCMTPFELGFSKNHSYDQWWGPASAYYCSIYYNIGAAFANKFLGIYKEYILPPDFDSIFNALP